MSKSCIFTLNKICDNCGACNVCDINSDKTCNNCGKCLETTTNDYKEVVVDEIDDLNSFDSDDDLNNNEIELTSESSDFFELEDESLNSDEDINIDYIDDVEGLSELLEDPEKGTLEEVFPGFFIIKNDKRELH
jgi:hypothetical protein